MYPEYYFILNNPCKKQNFGNFAWFTWITCAPAQEDMDMLPIIGISYLRKIYQKERSTTANNNSVTVALLDILQQWPLELDGPFIKQYTTIIVM